ncbi:MAG: hypothetical protein J0H52_20360 [Comamonadaceae bacterium]|nr:hypothetical protein [Comamonadaceae bacterium]
MSDIAATPIPSSQAAAQAFYYAHLDASDAVIAVAQSNSPIDSAQSVQIDGLREELLGQRYDREASAAAGEPVFVHAPVVPVPEVRRISVGAFFDRFGSAKWAILADATPVVAAVVRDASVRKYIDLDNPDLPAGIALLRQAGHDVDADAIIAAAVQPGEHP